MFQKHLINYNLKRKSKRDFFFKSKKKILRSAKQNRLRLTSKEGREIERGKVYFRTNRQRIWGQWVSCHLACLSNLHLSHRKSSAVQVLASDVFTGSFVDVVGSVCDSAVVLGFDKSSRIFSQCSPNTE